MMLYPAQVGLAYLDLYEATKDEAMLAAAKRIADTYRKTQQPNGTWPLLVDAQSGARLPEGATELVPDGVVLFLERLIEKHGFKQYLPMSKAAWRWIEQEIASTFRFEGQFEDVNRRGGRSWNLSPLPACSIAERLLRRHGDSAPLVALAEEMIRFAEDQFVIWEQPVPGDVSWRHFPLLPFTPSALEQYAYMVPIAGSAAKLMEAFQAAYQATGKEIYLAKAAAFANAMTVIQASNGGDYVGTTWNPTGQSGGWPNVHVYSAVALAAFGGMLERKKLRLDTAK
jgi:maltose/maltodextrin transport system substrate-binding protein